MHSPPGDAEFTRTAFPHSEIPGSKVVYTSPRLIAADHVLHRLSAPRHPPHTLSSLTTRDVLPSPGAIRYRMAVSRAKPRVWTHPVWRTIHRARCSLRNLFTCQRPSLGGIPQQQTAARQAGARRAVVVRRDDLGRFGEATVRRPVVSQRSKL